MKHPFPTDVWGAKGISLATCTAEAMGPALEQVAHAGASPRVADLAHGYLLESLRDGAYYVYGAGTATRALLAALSARPGIHVLGIVDRLASEYGEFSGIPVVSPDAVGDRVRDGIVVCHTDYEPEMLRQLASSGVDSRLVRPVYSSRGFARYAARHRTAALRQVLGHRPVGVVVVNSGQIPIVPDAALAGVFDPDDTVELYVGRQEKRVSGGVYETFDLSESLDYLRAAITHLGPRCVYVRSATYKQAVGALVRLWFPAVALYQEFYDFTVLWDDADLLGMFGLDRESISVQRRAERFLCDAGDLVISKRGGAPWQTVVHSFGAQYLEYFPQVGGPAPAGSHRVAVDPVRVVYAGALLAPEYLAHFPAGYTFLPLLESLAASGHFEVTVFNSNHANESLDAVFGDYLGRYPGSPMTYRRALRYDQLMPELASHDIGWMADRQPRPQPDRQVAIGNRWAGYVNAGIPTVIDDGWDYMGRLVRQHGAGVVVNLDDGSFRAGTLTPELARSCRVGAYALREALLSANAATVQELAHAFSRLGKGNGADGTTTPVGRAGGKA